MRLEFDSVDELDHFLNWAANRLAPVRHACLGDVETYASAGDPIWNTPELTNGRIEIIPPDLAGEVETLDPDPNAQTPESVEPAKRKRRTKVEIEAAKAAEQEAKSAERGDGKAEVTPAGTVAQVAPENNGNPFAQASLPAAGADSAGTVVTATPADQSRAAPPADATPEQAKQWEVNEFVASRLAERPEVSNVEHLNLARTFIGKHGMARYNESFPLVGLSANVMAFTPADCARHAAVLDFLGME